MKVKSTGTGFGLTKGRIYSVVNGYDTVYGLECGDGKIHSRLKGFFETVEERKRNLQKSKIF
ncbi:MAG: hypothetical protein NC489_31045 [Ruminococcus flavefaciens]|nr:hypothetical protein [Ruminococcus flavefaciens]